MTIDFVKALSINLAQIPPDVYRLAGFFLVMQVILIVFRKKNNPDRDIWEDLAGVLLSGLVVYMFPEIARFMELLVNSLCHVDAKTSSALLDYVKDTTVTDVQEQTEMSTTMKMGLLLARIFASGGGNWTDVVTPTTYFLADGFLKPLADIVNAICFPTYLIIRAVCLKVTYFLAPLVLVMGAMPSYQSLWKQWFLVYLALLVSGPALFLANDLCEQCFAIYIQATNSPMLGFFIIAIARFKVFQGVVDLCYRIFRA